MNDDIEFVFKIRALHCTPLQSSIFPKMLNHSLRSLIKGEICKDWPTVEFKLKTSSISPG